MPSQQGSFVSSSSYILRTCRKYAYINIRMPTTSIRICFWMLLFFVPLEMYASSGLSSARDPLKCVAKLQIIPGFPRLATDMMVCVWVTQFAGLDVFVQECSELSRSTHGNKRAGWKTIRSGNAFHLSWLVDATRKGVLLFTEFCFLLLPFVSCSFFAAFLCALFLLLAWRLDGKFYF